MTSRIDLAMKIQEHDEGFEPEPYYCSEKFPTIGHGFRIEGTKQHDPLPKNMTITYTDSLAKLHAKTIANDTKLQIHDETKTAYEQANDLQKAVILSMVHQLGFYGFLKFKKFLIAARNKDWDEAAKQVLDSVAARQTPKRWARNAEMIESGEMHSYYS